MSVSTVGPDTTHEAEVAPENGNHRSLSRTSQREMGLAHESISDTSAGGLTRLLESRHLRSAGRIEQVRRAAFGRNVPESSFGQPWGYRTGCPKPNSWTKLMDCSTWW